MLHNQINLGNHVSHNLLDYGNEYIEYVSLKVGMARNSLLVTDFSIDEKVKLREKVDILEEGKELHSLQNIKRRDMTPITSSDGIFYRDLKINGLNKKREMFSNDAYNIQRYKYKSKEMLKESKKDRNRNRVDLI